MSIGKGITEVKMGLTQKQARFLKVIKDFVAANGYAPSYEEMKQLNGLRSNHRRIIINEYRLCNGA